MKTDARRVIPVGMLFLGILLCRLPEPEDGLWEETLWQAQSVGFSYARQYRLARNADPEALYELQKFTGKTDAAGSLGHGVALVEVIEAAGDAAFSRQLGRLTPEIRHLIPRMLCAGLSYGPWRDDRDGAVRSRYPLTSAAAER